jgi:competence protein ComEC
VLKISVAFLAGICLLQLLPELPATAPWATILAVLIGMAALQRHRWVCALLLGVAWSWFRAQGLLAQDLPVALEGQDLEVTGYIASIPARGQDGPQFLFEVAEATEGVPSRLRLSWYDKVQPEAGESWRLVVRLKRRHGFANPGGFDYEQTLFRAGVGATGYVRNDTRNQRLQAASGHYVLRLRAWLASRMVMAVGPTPMIGVLQGLAIGEDQAISTEQWRVFAATGTSHLMAISGLHISMVAMLCAALGGCIVYWPQAQARRLTRIEGQAVGGLLGGIGYSLLSGFSVPAQRTLLMLTVYFVARWSRRQMDIGPVLGFALCGVLLLDPLAPMSPGFWLSFGAVAVIVMSAAGELAPVGNVRGFARVQLAVSLGLVPLLLLQFGNLSLIAPVVNVVAVPLFTLAVVPLVLLGTMAAAVSVSAGSVLLGAAAKLLEVSWPAFEWAASLPLSLWYLPRAPLSAYALMGIGSALILLPFVWPVRLAAGFLLLPALLFEPTPPAQGEVELNVLDVGQGLAVVVRTRSHVLVYDAGPRFRSGRDTAELVVLPFLRYFGIRQVSALMISHGDDDHFGGAKSLTTGMPVERIIAGPSVPAWQPGIEPCVRGMQWDWDGVRFTVLHPGSEEAVSDNESSCVLDIRAASGSALLLGDIERGTEQALVAAGAVRPTDVVVVAHHGSRTSSTAPFVALVQAKLAIFSAGYRNRWGFPKADIVERWAASGASGLTTSKTGAIRVGIQTAGLDVREHRRAHRRYWHDR